jgi:uncharacterized protein (TIGR00369 family)
VSEVKENSVFESDDLLALARDMFESKIAFNRLLGLKILSIGENQASTRIDMRDEFIGNHARGILHGGVISATLDATAGLVAFTSLLQGSEAEKLEERIARFARVGTIDMRVDYLRPGRGTYFIASARTLRKGSRVAVIHTEMHDDSGEMIASGTCTYMVG